MAGTQNLGSPLDSGCIGFFAIRDAGHRFIASVDALRSALFTVCV